MLTTKYLSEINAFYNWIEFNQLSATAHALWHTLMSRNNRYTVRTAEAIYWRVEFSVPNAMLFALLDIKNDMQLKKARDELIAAGRIAYKNGTRSQLGVYRMIPFDETLETGMINGVKVWICKQSFSNPLIMCEQSVSDIAGNPSTIREQSDSKKNSNPLVIREDNIDLNKNIDIYNTTTRARAREEPQAEEAPKNELPAVAEKTIPPEIITAIDKAMIMLSPATADKLMSWLDDMEIGVVVYAIEQADANGKRNMAYIEAILRHLHNEGIKTVTQVRERDMKFKSRKRFSDKDTSVYKVSPDIDFEEIERLMDEKY